MGNQESKYKRLGKNTFFVFVGNVGPRLISFILMPFYTFWLSESDFGIQDIISVYSILVIPFITLGLYEAVFVFPKGKDKQKQSLYFSASLIVITLAELLLGLFFIIIPTQYLQKILPDRLFDYSTVLFWLIIIESFQRVLQSFTRGIDRMKVYSMTGIVYSVVMLLLALYLIPKWGLNGYWCSLIVADLSSVLYTFISIKGWNYLCFVPNWKVILKEMLFFSLPLVPNATMWWIINSINRPILIDNVGLDGVGLYAVAGKFPSIINIIFSIFFSAFQISALEEFYDKDFKKFYTNVFKAIFCIQIIITGIFEIFGEILFKIFIDDKFFSATYYLPILCVGVVISNIACYVGVSFTVVKQTKYFLYSTLIGAIIAIVANTFLIPAFGIMGACLSIIISQTGMLVYRYCKSTKFISFDDALFIISQFIIYAFLVLGYYFIGSILIRNIAVVMCIAVLIVLNRNIIKRVHQLIVARIIKATSKTFK